MMSEYKPLKARAAGPYLTAGGQTPPEGVSDVGVSMLLLPGITAAVLD